MPPVHTYPNDGEHTPSLGCWCCPVAINPDTEAELSNGEAALRESLNEPMQVIHNRARAGNGRHVHHWTTFGPGGPLETAVTICLDCGKIHHALPDQHPNWSIDPDAQSGGDPRKPRGGW